ncbi:hypothetical protein BDZ89DRAFT_1056818 [Hymenopellis radicata]|nr:hypothetical protein BDZ89DRAFT_1056818 [Hymenopellis radicata]
MSNNTHYDTLGYPRYDGNPALLEGHSYELCGGNAARYEVKPPESVQLVKSNSYMGRVHVGRIERARLFEGGNASIHTVLVQTPVKNGKPDWNCQNWVMDALYRLRMSGQHIVNASHEEILQQLAFAKRER